MSKDLKKVYSSTIIQIVIYVIALAMAFLNRGISPNWPFYLVLAGILGGFFLPKKYRSQFSSTAPGIFLKNRTRRTENIIELTVTCFVIFLVIYLNLV
ncbi:hypothetical protein [Enterococcus sp. DIV1059_2]|uniref:hypothetical protein n=1 Tax=Enterococcus sp. DIV1059_2 TaxID=2774664 RepID=UPI003F23DA67